MTARFWRGVRTVFPAACAIVLALLCRRVVLTTKSSFVEQLANFLRIFLYLSLFAVWGTSAHRRVLQPQVRRMLALVAGLMIGWLVVREFRWHLVLDPAAGRWLWYAYYIPILCIPLIAFFVSLSLGRGEDYRLPGWTLSFLFPTLLLIAAALTNDLHGRLFLFPADAAQTELDYRYGALYYVMTAWGVFCTLAAFFTMLRKCRSPGKFLWTPLLPFAAALLYLVLYAARVPFVTGALGDLTVFDCLAFTAFFESCIQCGLIPSNSRYSDLFRASEDLSVQITDRNYAVRYASRGAEQLSKEEMLRAETAPVLLQDGKRLHNLPVNGGHALWTEDLSELLEKRETLESIREQLSDRSELTRLEFAQKKEHASVEEQNRLYDLMRQKTQSQIDRVRMLAAEYEKTEDPSEKRRILARIVVLGSYIKRRRDFVLTRADAPLSDGSMLTGAFAESFRALSMLGVSGAYYVNLKDAPFSRDALTLAYDFFECAMEAALDTAKHLNVRVSAVNGTPRCSVETDGAPDPAMLTERYPTMRTERDEDGCTLLLPLTGGEPA